MDWRNPKEMGVRGRAKLSRRNIELRRSDRYDGPSLFTDLKARRSSLYSVLCSIGSQR